MAEKLIILRTNLRCQPNNYKLPIFCARWGRGDAAALTRLTPLVYEQLRRLAASHMRKERPGHGLQTTALVHEAYLRLEKIGEIDWHDRGHFFAVSARIMRRILVDAARAQMTTKRGGAAGHVAHASTIDFDRFPSPLTPTVPPNCVRWTMRLPAWRRSIRAAHR